MEVHSVYFNESNKNTKTRNEGEELRSGSAHTKYGAPWANNSQGLIPPKVVNYTYTNATAE